VVTWSRYSRIRSITQLTLVINLNISKGNCLSTHL
jgi:hypothetical protein